MVSMRGDTEDEEGQMFLLWEGAVKGKNHPLYIYMYIYIYIYIYIITHERYHRIHHKLAYIILYPIIQCVSLQLDWISKSTETRVS
jgi:hypothetical protein